MSIADELDQKKLKEEEELKRHQKAFQDFLKEQQEKEEREHQEKEIIEQAMATIRLHLHPDLATAIITLINKKGN